MNTGMIPTNKTIYLILFCTGLLLINANLSHGQIPPEEFFIGLELLDKDQDQAKKEFQIAAEKEPAFYGTYHFLGVIALYENKPDSAILNFKRSIDLNTDNMNHTREMTYVRLMDTYLYGHDFQNAFNTAWEAYLQYPENAAIERDLKDICLWALYIRHNALDSSYLSPQVQDEYIVRSVPEEYLIMRKIRIDDRYLNFTGQSLISKKKNHYDILSCTVSGSNEEVELKFKLDWDMSTQFGGITPDTDEIYANEALPVYERMGALIASDPKTNLKAEIEKLLGD